ncbi:hypothetical protein JCM10213_008448 [Rhodosporidiobolus nylandii]
MSAALPSLRRVFRRAVKAGDHDQLNSKAVRARLGEVEGWTCSDEEWRGGMKERVVDAWQDLLEQHDNGGVQSSQPPAKKRRQSEAQLADAVGKQEKPAAGDKAKGKSKYERTGEKNFKTFMGALGGLEGAFVAGLGGGGGADMDDDDSSLIFEDPSADIIELPDSPIASGSGSAPNTPPTAPDSPAAPVKEKEKKKPAAPRSSTTTSKPKKERKSKKAAAKQEYKSAEFIDSSDDSSHEAAASKPVVGGSSDGEGSDGGGGKKKKAAAPRKRKSDASENGGGKGKGKAKEEKEKKPKAKKEKKPPAVKEGDAPKGSEAEEARVAKLKSLLTLASGPRPFNAATGAERKLSVQRRTEILEGLLAKLGLAVGAGGKLPSENKAKEVGEKRQLAKEMAELEGAPLTSGLRDGKHVMHLSDSDDDDAAGPASSARKKRVMEQRKSFGAFLGDQSSDED